MTNPAAEEKKELGNKAFGEKDFDQAIKLYSEAIDIDPKNHVYFSNRCASYSGKSDWEPAAKDAKECIRLDPSFIKGYYRLATAQIQLNELESALTTVKQGLNIDPDNSQLLKLLRTVKAKRASAKRSSHTENGSAATTTAATTLPSRLPTANSALSREIMDLQEQYVTTNREFNTAKAHLVKSQREQKMNEITTNELEKIPMSSSAKMYRGIGKMFMLSDRGEIYQHLTKSVDGEKKRQVDLTQKMEYLERKMKSQQQNIQELVKSPSSGE